MSLDQLKNKGFAFLNIETMAASSRTIVVVGAARGGTSLVAGALKHLGVFTGKESCSPVFEDVALSSAFEANNMLGARAIVEDYEANHSLWAWKRPGSIHYFDRVKSVIKNPFYIFVFKDIFSIANRNSISMKTDITIGLRQALQDYIKIIDIIENSKQPCMLVSSEKALQNKTSFVDALIDMNKDIKDLSANRQKALDFISPDPQAYLDATRITKAKGSVVVASDSEVSGWALLQFQQQVVNVEIYVDGKLYASKEATEYRDHLEQNKQVKSAYHGFSFDISEIKRPCDVMVKAKGDVIPLRNGNFELK